MDTSEFVGYLGRRGKSAHQGRIWKRYIFLREKFKLDKEEAMKLAKALEKWWDGAPTS